MQFLKGDIQEGILKAAEEVFLEKGYKDASMREIASRAGVTVSNIYHYFTNKDEIFRTILKPVLNDLYAMIEMLADKGIVINRRQELIDAKKCKVSDYMQYSRLLGVVKG
jgi:AcrR family transcriptional regulator